MSTLRVDRSTYQHPTRLPCQFVTWLSHPHTVDSFFYHLVTVITGSKKASLQRRFAGDGLASEGTKKLLTARQINGETESDAWCGKDSIGVIDYIWRGVSLSGAGYSTRSLSMCRFLSNSLQEPCCIRISIEGHLVERLCARSSLCGFRHKISQIGVEWKGSR